MSTGRLAGLGLVCVGAVLLLVAVWSSDHTARLVLSGLIVGALGAFVTVATPRTIPGHVNGAHGAPWAAQDGPAVPVHYVAMPEPAPYLVREITAREVIRDSDRWQQ
ncbi:hypothetical protein MM440_12325 [Arsenicicoccus piscis]|uniref:Uncharacterized protein n=1 Tax=Arsenicicoccus piscis TaxID=673954 RepID=A0ABQ6HQR7_9MICO|nr:hypothetical protein [Arsenicicoccus piscis]MCH8628531.1 hypothetical protein [Arsenicicoccus piscis]GMA19890.1 hypothetical protein GCM10025862_19110 [Arsenicicoccus piscis]